MVSRNAVRALIVAATAAAVAACSSSGPSVSFKQRSKEFFSEAAYGKASPRVVTYGPVPKGGGRVVVGDAYRVAGKTYIPRDNPRYSATGLASWYGDAFHGRLTANGEVYDVNGLTAAHPTLPLPSYARVTNLKNGRSIIVRVNDRGPFAHDRIIDVSAKVAGMLDFQHAGTAKVKVDYVGPAQMVGLDQNMLMASYSASGATDNVRFASLKPQNRPVLVASAPKPRIRPVLATTFKPKVLDDEEQLMMPAYAPAEGDLLAPLILRSSFINSYAADAHLSAAQQAASDLATSSAKPDLQASLDQAAARKAAEMGTVPATADGAAAWVVQIGAFANPATAELAAADFRRFGRVETYLQESDENTLSVVRVVLDEAVAPLTVVNAATDAGLSGAFILDR